MYGLDLFSGIGGITKALEKYVTPIAYCENDRHAQAVLLSRMLSCDLPLAPIWDDVRTLRGATLAIPPSIIYGGFPCQDISVAGSGAGLEGKRSGLFFEIARLVGEIRPRFIFLENVPAITSRGGVRVTAEFTTLGYDCRWCYVSAADVGANHLRERWWLLANTQRPERGSRESIGHEPDRENGEREKTPSRTSASGPHGRKEIVAHTPFKRRHENGSREPVRSSEVANSSFIAQRKQTNKAFTFSGGGEARQESGRRGWWSVEPDVGRVAHGIPFRVDRLRGLGNAVVPAQAREAFERLMGLGRLTE